MEQKIWHTLSPTEALKELSSAEQGLTDEEAAKRLAANGANELTEKKPVSPLTVFLGQFKNIIIWVLIAAGIVSAVAGESLDAIAIFAIVLLNTGIGFSQEFKAGKAIAALKKMTAPKATVSRGGRIMSVPAVDIVTGDVLALQAGDLIAADARIIEASSLRCVEAVLTGESAAVDKTPNALEDEEIPIGDRNCMVFMGTVVASGSARAVVASTAMESELGKIAMQMDDKTDVSRTPFEKKMNSFGGILALASLAIITILFVLGFLRGTPLFSLFMTSVSLAVAAVPEGLPAIVTIALSLGVLKMSRRHALMRNLPAVETLGSTTVICTDKTGTLTAGEMTVRALYVAGKRFSVAGEGYAPSGEISFAETRPEGSEKENLRVLSDVLVGCNDSHLAEEDHGWKIIGDPSEGALLVAGIKAGNSAAEIGKKYPMLRSNPFDSNRKLSSAVRSAENASQIIFVNGAPEILLEKCTHIYSDAGVRPITDDDRRIIKEENASMAARALRVLASGRGSEAVSAPETVEKNLTFIGLSGMYDPPRPEAKAAVASCAGAGIRVVMITGDHPQTAIAIAREIGIASPADEAVTGIELDGMPEETLARRVREIVVYARVNAEHKLRIVRAWKANGAVVAMTGDGVNDAPAIQGADIGIAMGRAGTEVTRQAADMILTDDNFATIVAAVGEGRGIFGNIRKTLQYLLAGNSGELLLMAVCVIAGLPMPLLPIHLLLINLVTDGLPALCLATDPIDPDVMKNKPAPASNAIIDGAFLFKMGATALLTAGVCLAVFTRMLDSGSVDTARTGVYAVLVFSELLRAFGARSETKSIFRIRFFSNLPLVLVVALSVAFQILTHRSALLAGFLKTTTIPFATGALLLLAGSIPLIALEILKKIRTAHGNGQRHERNNRMEMDAAG
jgi:Ca2+-transporting ATPase